MPPAAVRSSRVVVPHATRWYQHLAARLVYAVIRIISVTLRFKWTDRSGTFAGDGAGPAIYCVWHNRLALCMSAYHGYIQKHNQSAGLAVMVSASKDGALLSGVLECFGVQPVRGSTSRRGHQALRELATWARRNYDVAITPDGPRGPCYVAQEGIIALGQLTERDIVPVSYNLDWKIRLNSWDKFHVPLPFSRCEMIFEKPIRVPRHASESDREQFRLQLEEALNGMSRD